MKITLDINDIDYGALVEVFLPKVSDELAKQDGIGVAILAKIAKMPPAIARKMIDMLPQETKDEIAVMLVNKNKEKIIEAVMEYAERMGLAFHIDSFDVI